MNPTLVRLGVILALALAVGAVVQLARWRIRRRQAWVLAEAPALDLLSAGRGCSRSGAYSGL